MITSLSIAVKIWAKTITMLILVVGIGAIQEDGGWALLIVGLGAIFGYLLTSPLLIIISPLIKLSARIPYANRSRMAWLVFCLFLSYLLIFIGLMLLVGKQSNFMETFKTKQGALFMLSINVVQYIAVRTTRKSLYKLYNQL